MKQVNSKKTMRLQHHIQIAISNREAGKRYRLMSEKEKDVQNLYDELYRGKCSFRDEDITIGCNPYMEKE